MSIDEAIVHAREVAEIHRNNDKLNKTLGKSSPYYNTDCIKCAEEHEQLAEWLEELKSYRQYIDLTEIPEQYKLGFQDGIISVNNKAIDDFVSKLKAKCDVMINDKWNSNVAPISWAEAYADFKDGIDEIAEQLKAGRVNERSI